MSLPLGLFFPSSPCVSAFTTFETPSPLHFIFNQSGCETLPGCCSNVTHPAGGNFQSQGRHSISGVVITEDRVCPPSFLRYYLLPAPAEASPPPHENPIIIRGHTSFSSFSRDRTPENSTKPQMNIDFFFSRPFPNFLLYFFI